MKKIIIFFLVISFVLAPLSVVLAGCADKDPPPPDNTDGNTVDSGGETEKTEVWDDIPKDTNFDDTELTFLVWTQCIMKEFDSEGIVGDLVGDELYDRNIRIEDQLGVKLTFIRASGSSESAGTEIRMKAEADIKSGIGAYDVLAGTSRLVPAMALNGSVYDLNTLEHLNFDKPYYPASLTGNCEMNGKLFWLTGDISTNLLWLMYVTIYSKEVFTTYDLEDPYDLVRQNRWTLDKLIEMTTGCYEDNGNDIVDDGDFFGLTMYELNIDAFIGTAGVKVIEKNIKNELILSPDLKNQKTIDLIEKLGDYFANKDITFDTNYDSARRIFFEERAIFLIDSVYLIAGMDKRENEDKIDFKYGIIPTPKYDDLQEDFITPISHHYTNYGILISSNNVDASAAVLERMGAENYNNVTPLVFETAMKERYASDNDASEMFDLIRSGLSIDMGRLYTVTLGSIHQKIRLQIENNSKSYTSLYQSMERTMTRVIDNLNKFFYD